MTLLSDLSRLIEGQLDKNSISYDRSMPLHRLVARYFELNVRQVQPVPRRVHFSDRTHASLGELSRRGKVDPSAQNAWGAVFRLRQLLVEGANVNGFLSTRIRRATGWDGLLWHYGMHHFHLSSDVGVDGFVKRSDHLLFAIVAPLDAYFVDVRPHPSKDGVEWVSQELLHIVHSNWPQLIEANVLHSVCGTQLTDGEIHQLRRKSMNYAIEIDGKAIAPLGGGMAGDGSSVLCTIFASKLLRDLRHHEEVLNNDEIHEAVARNLRAQGFDAGPTLEFELVFLENLSPPPELLAALTVETCVSRDLCRTGLAIIEKTTGSLIVLHDTLSLPFNPSCLPTTARLSGTDIILSQWIL